MIYVSVVSVWEVGIKLKKNHSFSLKTSLKKTFTISGFEILPVTFEHTLEAYKVPLHRDHKDPFDRLLIAQAKFENLTLITADPKIWKYKIPILRAI